jgi:hypothetical protein
MSNLDQPTFPVSLTQAQRRVVAANLPGLKPRLHLDKVSQRAIQFTLAEVSVIVQAANAALSRAQTGMERNSLGRVVEAAERTLQRFQDGRIAWIPAAQRLYQFKITLMGIQPLIWRRIQIRDCTLDRLHVYIQTAMGWTNSHLHQFVINGVLHGDPELLCDGWENETQPVDSLDTRISSVIPQDGQRFRFEYEYDFGDQWTHEVLLEGCLRAEKGHRYPLCVEGERACPPEDVGGVPGYQQYLETLSDPDHEEWEETSDWRGPWRPEHFDATKTTKRMRRGLPNWRE